MDASAYFNYKQLATLLDHSLHGHASIVGIVIWKRLSDMGRFSFKPILSTAIKSGKLEVRMSNRKKNVPYRLLDYKRCMNSQHYVQSTADTNGKCTEDRYGSTKVECAYLYVQSFVAAVNFVTLPKKERKETMRA